MAIPFENSYTLRRVAEHSSKACLICYKPTTNVLVSSDGKADFFYICGNHLKDSSFATPQLSPEVQQAKARQEELEKEIELVTKQWEEYQKKQKKKEKEKDKDKDKEKNEKEVKNNEISTPEEKLSTLEKKRQTDNQLISCEPRQFILNRDIYNLRLGNWRSKQTAKQTQKILQKPNLFPNVPTHLPGSEKSKNSDP